MCAFRRGLQVSDQMGGRVVPVRYPAVNRRAGQPVQYQRQMRGLRWRQVSTFGREKAVLPVRGHSRETSQRSPVQREWSRGNIVAKKNLAVHSPLVASVFIIYVKQSMKTMFIGPLNRTSDSICICAYAIAVVIGDAAEGVLVGRKGIEKGLAKSFCNEMGTIKTICQLITGDALLYSMFRESGNPMQCPFKPPYTFTYNRGHGDCKNPVSTVEACTQDSRLLFRYQACPDVEGSESALEEVECIAGWKEGSYRFLVGRVHHSNGIPMSTEDRFKCFIYERTTSQRQLKGSSASGDVEYRVAQSGDATCSGLFSPLEGSRTMILKKEIFETKCSFPLWLTENQKWRTLDHGKTFTFPHHHNNNTLKLVSSSLDHVFAAQTIQASHQFFYNQPLVAPLPGHEMKFSCQQEMEELPHRFRVMAHYVTGCQSGYICLDFHRRAHDLAELQMGQPSRRPEDACNSANFDAHATDSITLVAYKSDFRNCPYKGIYTIKKISKSMSWNDASSTLPSKTNLNLPVDLLTSDNHPSIVLTTTSPPSPKRHSSEHYEKSSDDWSVTYKKLQPDLPSLVRSRKNISKEFERLSEYDDDDESILRRVKRKGRRILSSKTITDEECKLNLTSIVFSCGSTDSIELVAECPRLTHIRSGMNKIN
ncbi:hypothetical protein AGLY_004956 [Aphis glycines]|uniref:Uncharacterized protein n=1 Tax=Aphis glycines TaxID=307491 RepID=A0A6G0TVR9_APHGL|nr:hypothetical protein AGLY_004956 [Aphis glycines]